MLDQRQAEPQPAGFGPEVHAANQISVSVNVSDITMLLGVGRAVLDAANGHPLPVMAIEWKASYPLSPPTAVSLYEALGRAIKQYEDHFGAIPKDPNFQLKEQVGAAA